MTINQGATIGKDTKAVEAFIDSSPVNSEQTFASHFDAMSGLSRPCCPS
jgi:hypothetical protein